MIKYYEKSIRKEQECLWKEVVDDFSGVINRLNISQQELNHNNFNNTQNRFSSISQINSISSTKNDFNFQLDVNMDNDRKDNSNNNNNNNDDEKNDNTGLQLAIDAKPIVNNDNNNNNSNGNNNRNNSNRRGGLPFKSEDNVMLICKCQVRKQIEIAMNTFNTVVNEHDEATRKSIIIGRILKAGMQGKVIKTIRNERMVIDFGNSDLEVKKMIRYVKGNFDGISAQDQKQAQRDYRMS